MDCKGNSIRYEYDELGNLSTITYPGNEVVQYAYYKNGWLHTVTDAEGKVTAYGYDRNGNLTSTKRPNGTEEICTYNAAGLLIEQKDVAGEEILTSYTYSYDERGNIISIAGTENEAGLCVLTNTAMSYDMANRLITYNGEEVRYDADGNMIYGPVNGEMTELVYDCRNRLVNAGGVSYTYDAENTRIATETENYVEEYVTDMVSSSLSRVLTSTVYEKLDGEILDSGTCTVYFYGNGLISEKQGNEVLYHHYNHLGSTVKLTDAEGKGIASYTYGTYGELLSGNVELTCFLYNGRDGVSTEVNGLYYMRQRYYSPEIKRFVNQDIIRGVFTNSQSLNRYSYVQGNPVSYVDPFGLAPQSSQEVVQTDTPQFSLRKFLIAKAQEGLHEMYNFTSQIDCVGTVAFSGNLGIGHYSYQLSLQTAIDTSGDYVLQIAVGNGIGIGGGAKLALTGAIYPGMASITEAEGFGTSVGGSYGVMFAGGADIVFAGEGDEIEPVGISVTGGIGAAGEGHVSMTNTWNISTPYTQGNFYNNIALLLYILDF